MTERLPAYDGVLSARLQHRIEEEKRRNPSAKALTDPNTRVVEGTTAVLQSDPALAGIVEVVQV